MTLPSKSIESSSLGNSFQSGDRRRDLHPDDLSPRDLYPDRGNGEVAPGDDLRLQSATDQPLPQQQQQQQQQHPTADEVKTCKVCGDTATGMYFGALVCVPCKTFFLRYAGDGFAYECKNSKNCEVTTGTRTQCKFCRYQKCLRVGMCRRVRPAQVEAQDGQQLCIVCQDVANGVHFGVLTCEGCKKFFRRGLTEQKSYRCRGAQNCCINPSNRNACRYCRFQKCIRAGMSREAIQMGRPSKIPVFDRGQNHHQRSHGGDRSRDPGSRGQQQHPVGLLRTPATTSALHRDGVARGPVDYRGGPGATTSRQPNGALFPSSWPPDDGRETLSQRYDRILAAKKGIEGPGPGDWPPVGCYPPQPPPFVIVPKSGSDEGEKSDDGSTGRPDNADTKPASWRREDEFELSDPLSGLRATGSYWNHRPHHDDDGDYFFSRKRRNSSLVSGFRDAVTLNPSVKQEVRSSDDDDDDDDDYEAKRMRRDGCAPLPQDPHQLRLAGRLDALSAGQTLSRFHENPYSAEALEDYIPNPGGGSGGHEGPPVQPELCHGSPGDVSSSPGRRVKDQIGSTRGQVAVGREFESRRYDREFSGDRDYSDDGIGGVPGDVGFIDLLGGGQLGPQAEEVGNQCWRTIKQVIPAYHRFVSAGTTINQQLKKAHEIWMRENPRSDSADELSSWIQTSVVPAYTTVSVAYCKCLPDFTNLCVVDQRALVAGGQSQSRILTAALHWYDVGEKRFRNFLSWRTEGPHRADVFKAKLLAFAERVTKLHLDPIEAALLNALGLFNSDYPKLQDRGAIEASREKISTTIKSYIAANHGAPGDRLECLWQVLKEAQVLGAEHVALTNTSTLGLPSTSEESGRPAEGASVAEGAAAPVSNAVETDDDRGSPSALGGRATNHPPREEEEEERPDDVPPSDHVMTRSPGSRDERPCVRTTTNGRTLAGSGLILGRQEVLPNSVVFRSDDDEEVEEVDDPLLPDSPGSVDVG